MIFFHYDGALEDDSENKGYYGVPYEKCTGNYELNMPDIILYIKESGGLKEFDYYC